jgi:hypothetical protein
MASLQDARLRTWIKEPLSAAPFSGLSGAKPKKSKATMRRNKARMGKKLKPIETVLNLE